MPRRGNGRKRRKQASGFRLQASGFRWRISARRDALGVCLLLRTKSQAPKSKQAPNWRKAPNPKHQITNKLQNGKFQITNALQECLPLLLAFGICCFAVWNLFVIWCL
jgi:hypothetical protein